MNISVHNDGAADLYDATYDNTEDARPEAKIIVCSAPRTASSRLCRLMTAAGLGLPKEYFNPTRMSQLCGRWGIPDASQNPSAVATYVAALQAKRTRHGIFSVKMHYSQFNRSLKNVTGETLFADATVIRIIRFDVLGQAASHRAALITGQWGTSVKDQSTQLPISGIDLPPMLKQSIERIIDEEVGWMRFFAYSGIQPIVITHNEVSETPLVSIDRIAQAVGRQYEVDAVAAIGGQPRYQHSRSVVNNLLEAGESLRPLAFQVTSNRKRKLEMRLRTTLRRLISFVTRS
jgi:LPS sulfotransferase NodH